MTVRHARLEDIPSIAGLAEEMHVEGDYKNVPFCREMYEDFLKIALQQDTYCLFLYEKDEGEIVGAWMGSVFCYMFSPLLQAADMGVFVKKEHRGSIIAPRLEAAYVEWALDKAREAGQPVIKIRADVSTGDTKAGAFYERRGYSYVGGNYSKDVIVPGVQA